jgi:hypothetical protein
VIPAELAGAEVARLWTFDRDGEREGWEATVESPGAVTVRDGSLEAAIDGKDPHLIGPPIAVEAAAFQFLALRCRSSVDGVLEVFFSKGPETGFQSGQVVRLPLSAGAGMRVHELDLRGKAAWTGTIDRLRLDPVPGTSGPDARFEVDWIALFQAPERVVPLLPHWVDGDTLALAFENRGGSATPGEMLLRADQTLLARVPVIGPRAIEAVEIDAASLPPRFWIEATLGGEIVWRGRCVRPCADSLDGLDRGETQDESAPAWIEVGCGTGRLGQGSHRAVLSPFASLTVRGPGRAFSYYEFDVEAAGREGSDAVYRELVHDPLLSDVACTVRVRGTEVRARIDTQGSAQVVRFEGPRLMQADTPSHALFPGLEYLEAGEPSSSSVWTGSIHAPRRTPAAVEITAPMIAFEYDRVGGLPPGSAQQTAWVVALSWAIEPSADSPAPVAEFRSSADEPSFATTFLPPRAVELDLDDWLAPEPWQLDAGHPMEIRSSFWIGPGTIEDVFAAAWLPRAPAPPAMAWLSPSERSSAAPPAGPGAPDALERVVAITMMAYTRSLFRDGRWKANSATQKPYQDHPEFEAAILAETARSGKAEYAKAVGLAPADRIEARTGTAAQLVNAQSRDRAAQVLEAMGPDGSIAYRLTPEMLAKIRKMTSTYGVQDQGNTLGRPGVTNSGLIAGGCLPLLEFAACTRDPVFVEGALLALSRMNQFSVPRGSQSWEIPADTPDLYAAAECASANLWGWRITGEEAYLDQAQRWLCTGLPFMYWWEPPDRRHVDLVQVADGLGEGPNIRMREPELFYSDLGRQVLPYASIPAFGTSWFAVPWFGIPVQWCGLAWGNVVREVDAVRPLPDYVRVADGIFRSAVNQQCDEGYLAGTLPDGWRVARRCSKQPFIAPGRLLEYAYRCLGMPPVGSTQYERLGGPRWTHVASQALLERVREDPGRLTIEARFFPGQPSSLIVGGPRGELGSVRVNDRELSAGNGPDQYRWIDCGEDRAVLFVPWKAGRLDRISIADATDEREEPR